jgi:hypothetical protein
VSSYGAEIMKEGKFSQKVKMDNPNEKFPISKSINTFEIFISNPKANEKIIYMKAPSIITNDENIKTLFKGQLANGGLLSSFPQSLSVIFACSPLNKSNSDVQVTLHFDTNTYINLFINKECNTLEEIQEYFTFLYIIYWIIILLIISFLVVLFFYYLKRNEITFIEFFDKIRELIKEKIEYYKINRNNGLESRGLMNSKNIEDDDLDYKITSTDPSVIEKDKKYKPTTFEYGGI